MRTVMVVTGVLCALAAGADRIQVKGWYPPKVRGFPPSGFGTLLAGGNENRSESLMIVEV